jgi:hypothetical protein
MSPDFSSFGISLTLEWEIDLSALSRTFMREASREASGL